jgi:phenylpyruvate tautomerase PptA (4-oxalocrotonate tautomerase family)
MPLIDFTFVEGSLDHDAQSRLAERMWSTALRWEGIEINATSASVAWVYFDERPRSHVTVAGQIPDQNIYRLNVRLMTGFMDQVRIDNLTRELTALVLEEDGSKGDGSGPRVFCIVEEIPSGTWSIDGKTWTTVFTAQTLGLDSARVDAMQKALATRPRIDVPYNVVT